MNWSRVKTILIVLFLCIDAFLLSSIIISERKSTRIAPEIIDSTVTLLSQNGISINKSIIPDKIIPAENVQVDNVISDQLEFASFFIENARATKDGFSSNDSSITFRGDYFHYATSRNDILNITGEKSAFSASLEFLQNRGFDLSSAKYKLSKEEGGFSITFQNYKNNIPMFGNSITMIFKDNSVTELYGSWLNEVDSDPQESNPKSITGILIDFMGMQKDKVPIEITSLEAGYSTLESDTYHKSAVLVPVWRITTKDGSCCYLDARNSE